ncbi:hypothetical protein [Candidatus Desulfosporosinus nitrosoreducens]|uniref:hypothetical protein n=1 Tax=Candidatus Desulfosporosinus nitrosoreducens TaxID=3401928 RepID=UPI00280C0FBE|nr:hypothetical protein [Desulfosporosinus sp. PR]
MINSIFESCQRISFEISLFGLLKGLLLGVLIMVAVFLEKKIALILQKERIIDKRVRETSTRIAHTVAEMEELKEANNMGEEEKQAMSLQPQIQVQVSTKSPDESDAGNQGDLEAVPQRKKTRAMSMEERWADFEKKRAMRNTA